MTQDEITAKIDELQTALNQLSQQLIQANPQAQNVIGQLNAYNELLAEPEKEPSLNKKDSEGDSFAGQGQKIGGQSNGT